MEAKTSNGTIRVGQVTRDTVTLHTSTGHLEIGTAAWRDLNTSHGRVDNSLDGFDEAPEKSEQAVEVHAHTSFGDITVRRS